jgi:hypothetical protein
VIISDLKVNDSKISDNFADFSAGIYISESQCINLGDSEKRNPVFVERCGTKPPNAQQNWVRFFLEIT